MGRQRVSLWGWDIRAVYLMRLVAVMLCTTSTGSFKSCPIHHPTHQWHGNPHHLTGFPKVPFLTWHEGSVFCLAASGRAEFTGMSSSSNKKATATKTPTEIDQPMPLLELSSVARISTNGKETVSTNKGKVNSKSSASGPKKTSKKQKGNEVLLHWRLDSDLTTFVGESSNPEGRQEPNLVHFTVRGNPLPLRRHRTSGGFMYNPSAKYQASFRNVTLQILNTMAYARPRNDDKNNTPLLPLFLSEQPIVMSILFRMKRPKSHFVGGKPGWDRLKDSAPLQTAIGRSDVDNLAKFVLDSLNGILYEDDRQVCSLLITKTLDNEDQCLGSTVIWCRQFTQSDVDNLPSII